MNRPELYNKTVDILYQAYFNDTLEHGNCYACAVGNIVTANLGYTYTRCVDRENKKLAWSERGGIYYYPGGGWFSVMRKNRIGNPQSKIEIDSTGYSIKELAVIESSFEEAYKGATDEDYMFNGLVAVLNTLREIHEVTDEDLLQANNKRFADHYKLKTAAV